MGLAETQADIKMARDQIAAVTTLDELKTQLLDNVLPLMDGIVDSTREEFARHGEVLQSVVDEVDTMVDESDDILQPETTGEILAVLELGKVLANELETLLKKADEITKKRVAPILKAYRQGAIVLGEKLAEITIPLEPEDDEPVAVAPGVPGAPVAVAEEKEGDDDEEDDDDDDDDDSDDEGDDDEGEDDEEDEKAAAPGKVK